MLRSTTFLVASSLLSSLAVAQNFSPIALDSVEDSQPDGTGDALNGPNFPGLIRSIATVEDRALQEFDVSSLAGMTITSANLSGSVFVNNAFDNGVRTFDFLLYAGNGTIELTDFQIPATVVGSDSYHPPLVTSFNYSFDVAATLQTLIDGGATFVGLRVEATSNPNFPNILDDTASLLSVTAIPGGVGTSYCTSLANSSGSASQISATGSTSVLTNNILLRAGPMAALEPGIFYYGPDQLQVPFGDGFRCVGGSVGTVHRLFPFVVADGTGFMTRPLDVSSPPTGGQILAGSTWNFQAWFRDPAAGMSGFNLSDGLRLDFLP
jgi:hypothetical protein